MRALIQRASEASVKTYDKSLGKISKGLLILLGVTHTDVESNCDYLVEKIINLRIFEDDKEKMNLSLLDIKGEILCVSQFTLFADVKKGRRPSFIDAAKPEQARELYNKFIQKLGSTGLKVEQGEFGAHMYIDFVNDGPVTIMLDTVELTTQSFTQ